MSSEEAEIRALIERWAKAVHACDIDSVLADHTDDIVMFDVPPPNEVRGKAAYRETAALLQVSETGRRVRDRLPRHHRRDRHRVRACSAPVRNR